ncbi:MAG: FAD-binding oxidoreductase [Pseudomonadota bacterium]
MAKPVLSWGRVSRDVHEVRHIDRLAGVNRDIFAAEGQTLFHGMGRSYGDVALNPDATLYMTPAADRILQFDRTTGLIRAEAGTTLADLNTVTVPDGWITPVSPGTKFVTLGGAVANDVHGKNHHQVGSFGAHVQAFNLRRSDGEVLLCTREQNSELFNATISGLGLTGYIEWVELQLKQIQSSNLYTENLPYDSLDAFFELSEQSADWPYTAAWVDCFSRSHKIGAGIFTRARFSDDGDLNLSQTSASRPFPIELPSILLNKFTISTFNWMYKRRPGARFKGAQNYQNFFYPLDSIQGWNKLYGRNGFYQHQSIIPMRESRAGITALLDTIRQRGQGSFLAVLKRHGAEQSPGLNSFPLEGVSLALDFPNRGQKTIDFLRSLDAIVLQHGGRMYPAKDALMTADTYQQTYPNWTQLEALRDPKITSSFWNRVTQKD